MTCLASEMYASEFNTVDQHYVELTSEIESELESVYGMIGRDPKILKIFSIIKKVANCDSTILINGETGTGKGLLAESIHRNSDRHNKPFIKINCGAIPDHLLESELFGHEKGSFTGATNSKPGKFEMADGGTIFLDEIGDMTYDLQVKVLRVLEEGEFERIGGCKTLKTNVRIIAATHRNLREEVKRGSFREDLYYRLYVIPIMIPSLKERTSDIPLLVSHFLKNHNKKAINSINFISKSVMEKLIKHAWPGNIRELKNVIERVVVLNESGRIDEDDLPNYLNSIQNDIDMPLPILSEEGICLNTAVTEFEKMLITQSLEKTKWVKNKAAKLLHLNRTTLVEKIKRYNLEQCSA